MAFWGIEVKPGKPYTHRHDNARGRLRMCQATLGSGKSASRSVVQCNVGEKAPILLCSLVPDYSETCRLELEFEEEDAVVFSVLGQRSVHLSGYYVGGPCCNSDGDETDSYGEDIAGTDTSGSYDSLDDEYESDFIDDDGDEMFLHSPRRKSGVIIEEIIEDEKPSNGNAGRRRLKKKHQLSDSDDDDSMRQIVVKQSSPSIFESEDEDGFPISLHSKNKNAANGPEENSKSDDMAVDEDEKRKVDAISQDGETAGEPADTSLPSEIGVENDEKKKKKRKKGKVGKPVETATKASAEEKVNEKLDKDQKKEVKEQNVESSGIETDVTENDSKPKKKKGKGKKSETDAIVPVKKTDEEVKEMADEPEKLPTENGQESSVKSKKKNRKRKGKDGSLQETEEKAQAIELQKSNTVEQLSNVAPGVESTDDDKKDAKRKKKKNIEKDSFSNQQAKVEAQSHKPRTFPNGLVIEDLAMGKPDGKRASDGSKVSVNYIGKLKNGNIFDSNVGQRPFKFRLGAGQVIKGWDVGVKGMRVGDKRRLTIPPSFGYGERGAGKKIPGNSWLVFDVELVGVQ
ncbi:peptidyl-prolyl cis-trans isomerase FKBP43-like isoform X1 [Iris pallida]|uniref:peptidylprolyl isomerase n=1 Tax=Iris pallida TaxID=29817 RepID=A0AAX6GE18_IRIPA|nr:peptidyl-prolyl cis-trans isomerase FKBP43-like isoform X1 [Iris pallida]